MHHVEQAFYETLGKNLKHVVSNATLNGLYEGYDKMVINRDGHTEFWSSYCDAISKCRKEGLTMHVSQISRETMPLIFKFNMEFEGQISSEDLYDEGSLLLLASDFQMALREIITCDDTSDNGLLCAILKTESEYLPEKDESVLEVRFHFPMLRMDREFIVKSIYPKIIDTFNEQWPRGQGIFHRETIKTNWKEMLDKAIVKKALPIYGSNDSKGRKCPDLRVLLKEIPAEITSSDAIGDFGEYILDINSLDPTFHTKVGQGMIKSEVLASIDIPGYWLPLIFSVDYWRTITHQIERAKQVRLAIENSMKTYDLLEIGMDAEVEEVSEVEAGLGFIEMWDPDRIVSRKYWKLVGEALYNIAGGEQSGLNMWVGVVKSILEEMPSLPLFYRDKNIRKLCENAYNTFRLRRVTIKTLAWYGRIDNPELYEVWHAKWCEKTDIKALSLDPTDVARAFYRVYWLDYMFTYDGESPAWYMFDGHRLIYDPKGGDIRTKLCHDFISRFQRLKGHVNNQVMRDGGKGQDQSDKVFNNVGKLVKLLKDPYRKRCIIEEAQQFFMHRNLTEILDENPEVMGVGNGVICATEHDIDFRPGKPEDYVSMYSRVMYRKDYSWEDPTVYGVLVWAKKTFIDFTIFNHFLKFLSSILRGGNNDKKFPAWTGELGDNSKSMWVKALGEVLGPYCKKMPMTMATGGRGEANGPSPALARTKGARVMILEEPEDHLSLQGGLIKHLTGSDTFYARGLNKEGGDITPQFKLLLVCNKIPMMPSGKAVKNRFFALPFESRWVNKPPPTEAERYEKGLFKINPFFDKKIPTLATGLLWVMVNYYPIYLKEGIRTKPPKIKALTKLYWATTDRYHIFVRENTEKHEGGRIELGEIYGRFKRWHKDSYPRLDIPDRPTFQGEMTKQLGDMVDALTWQGRRLLQERIDACSY
ncbi:D5 DNA Primase [uncultured virus]|nr:D5 DNA Primase [uncultured virus]